MSRISFATVAFFLLSASSGGPLHTKSKLLPAEEEFFDLNARIKEEKRIQITGDGKSDLDCSVFDDKANMVAKVDDTSDYCLLEFIAKANHYTIMIRNVGFDSDIFQIDSN